MNANSNPIREKVKKKIMDAYRAQEPESRPHLMVAQIAEILYPKLNRGEQQQYAAALHDLSKST